MSLQLSIDQARRVMLAAQGLAVPAAGNSLPATLEETGFVRTLGGIDVYLAVRARRPGMQRGELEDAVTASQVQVIPAARGCIYLVPRRDVAVALRFADLRTRARSTREYERAGIHDGELDQVGRGVLEAVDERGPSTTTALRSALPKDLVRSLGPAGKKVGISSTLPPALRQLEFAGEIERTLEGGRLDTERYLWRRPESNPFEESSVPEDPVELNARFAEIYFRAAGLGRLKGFAAWAGISQRDAKAAIASLSLIPVAVAGLDEEYLTLEERRGVVEDADSIRDALALLPFEDNLVALQEGPRIFVDSAFHDTPVPVWGRGKGSTVGDARHSALRSLAIGGVIAGFWEFDPDSGEIVTGCFAPLADADRERLEAATSDTARFIVEEMGHGRSFSLDTDDALRRRCATIRQLSG